ncbi:Translin family protein [Moelleriella libera RCEF 2490]|uniref:Translin family protein n=1 Tax=Moelleriella libera RCEF 2490 TaxID=1081109 RepID=A0A166V5E2_9HYPO|nr:Translin family protein [Moelleriella libera RCEF 2490]
MATQLTLLDPSIFADLESKIDEEAQVRDALTQIVQKLQRTVALAQALLARVHSTPRARYPALVKQAESAVKEQVNVIEELNKVASQHPHYKYNEKWTRAVQNAISTTLYCAWLGGFAPSSGSEQGGEGKSQTEYSIGRLLTLEEVGAIFSDRDAFHFTIEEYLQALTELTPELARLATNSVTLGDFELPLTISVFIKDVFSGFQLLNLKNDILRKRADAIKYDVKRVEDVVYDLSLRGLVTRPEGVSADTEMKSGE